MIPMPALCRLLDAGYHDQGALEILAPLSFNGVQSLIVEKDGANVALAIGSNEPTDWWDFDFAVWVRMQRGDSRTLWAAGPLSYASGLYNFWKGYLAGGGRIDEVACHSLGCAGSIAAASLGLRCTCFAPIAILAGSTSLDPSWVRNIALADEPLLTAARLTPWLSFFGPLEIIPVPAMWSPWRPASYGRIPDAHAVSRYAGAVPARSAFEVKHTPQETVNA
jgi:hypothetical protein